MHKDEQYLRTQISPWNQYVKMQNYEKSSTNFNSWSGFFKFFKCNNQNFRHEE